MHFVHPFRCIYSGPSQAGKSEFVKRVILEKLICGNIKQIVWCCKNTAFVPKELLKIENFSTHEGLPEINAIQPDSLIVIDDLMTEGVSKELCQLFTVTSHHLSVSIFYITQNIFHQGPLSRDISLSSNILVCFKNPRDKSQFGVLARQLAPENWRGLLEVYKEATREPFGYLFIDLSQQANELLRFKTNIFNKGYFECFHAECDKEAAEIEKVSSFITSTD